MNQAEHLINQVHRDPTGPLPPVQIEFIRRALFVDMLWDAVTEPKPGKIYDYYSDTKGLGRTAFRAIASVEYNEGVMPDGSLVASLQLRSREDFLAHTVNEYSGVMVGNLWTPNRDQLMTLNRGLLTGFGTHGFFVKRHEDKALRIDKN